MFGYIGNSQSRFFYPFFNYGQGAIFQDSSGSTPDTQGTYVWSKPNDMNFVYIYACGGGAGGSAGYGGTSTDNTRVGGQGGTAGSVATILLPSYMVPSQLYITLGARGPAATANGGLGGGGTATLVSITPNSYANGTPGITSSGINLVIAPGGNAGNTVNGPTSPGNWNPIDYGETIAQGFGFRSVNVMGSNGNGVIGGVAGIAGGAGGSITNFNGSHPAGGTGGGGANTTTSGAGGSATLITTGTTIAAATAGANGVNGYLLKDSTFGWLFYPATGGAGASAAAGGKGGDAGPGGGGGGGGAGTTHGAGGNGGAGFVIISGW
jgi:hypothetical protein